MLIFILSEKFLKMNEILEGKVEETEGHFLNF